MTETIGTRIRDLRILKNLTQAELTRAAGFKSHVTISRLENDVFKKPKLRTVEKVAKVLGVSTDYLLRGDDIKPSEFPELVRKFLQSRRNIEYLEKHIRSNHLVSLDD